MEDNKKKIAVGAGAVVIAGAIIGGLSHKAPVVVEAPKHIIVACKNATASKDYETLDGSVIKKGESSKMIAPSGQPFYFDGDCAVKK